MESDRLAPSEAHRIILHHLEQMVPSQRLALLDLQRVVERAESRVYAPGETILPSHGERDLLGLVVVGQVAVLLGTGTNARRTAILLPGHTFGRASSAAYPGGAKLQAISACQIWFLRGDELSPLIAAHQAEPQIRAAEPPVRHKAPTRPQFRRAALALVLMLGLTALVLLGLPAARQALALGAMAIGQVCRDDGSDRCAEEAWWLAASLAKADPTPLLALGMLFASRGDLTSAQRAFDVAHSLAPDAAEVHNNLGLVHAQRGHHQLALAAFRRAQDLQPGVAAVERNLASSLHALGYYEAALAHYQAALALGGSRAEILANMAIAYFQAGQRAEATDAARKALGYDGTLSPAYTVLGAVALESEQVEDALPYLNRAVALDPANAQAHAYLGLFYELIDQPAVAVKALEQALAVTQEDSMRDVVQLHLDRVSAREANLSTTIDGQTQNRR